jgi:hypothetical protein
MMAASVWLCDLLGLTQLLPALYFGEITWKDSPSWSHPVGTHFAQLGAPGFVWWFY